MTLGMRGYVCALWVSFIALSPIACQSIAGIEERTYDPKRAACESYCDSMEQKCPGREAAYDSRQTCMDVCQHFEPGAEPGGNTLLCRTENLSRANPGDAHDYCQAAGPAGDGACGTTCENYCALYQALCPPKLAYQDCVTKCAGLTVRGEYDPIEDYDADNVECRIVHLVAVARTGDRIHCGHADFVSTLHCKGQDDDTLPEPDCARVCNAVEVACEGNVRQYESRQQCLAVCNAIPKGKFADTVGNTVGCRYYHALNALTDPIHCSHAGPSGDDAHHCGDNCDSYCTLVQAGCEEGFDAHFPGGYEECRDQCLELEGGPASKYSVTEETEYACRLSATTQALQAGAQSADRTKLCDRALGISGCP